MLNGLDLFTGIGGLTMALSEWVRPVAYCERDRYAQGVILSRISDGTLPNAPIWDDVTTLRGAEIPAQINIIYGGFPCQDVSTAGLRKGLDGERSGLFREAVRLVSECRPQLVFLENVGGIRKYVHTVRKEFEELGYDCRDGFLSAADVGASHNRQRWWFLATDFNSKRCNGGSGIREGRHLQDSTIGESSQIQQQGNQWKCGTSKVHQAPTNSTGSRIQSRQSGRTESRKPSPRNENQDFIADSAWREKEPQYFVDGMVHGIPLKSHRIKSLGNAVVPLQAKEAFKRLCGIGGGE